MSLDGQCFSFASRFHTFFFFFFHMCKLHNFSLVYGPPRWPSGKASASRVEGPGFKSHLRRDFFGVESYQ